MKTTDPQGYMTSDTSIKCNVSGEITINDKYVYGYYNNNNITKVTFGSNVEVIMSYAFEQCYGITELDFSQATNLIEIQNNAFEYSEAIGGIDLSACTNLMRIGANAFNCFNGRTASVNLGVCRIMEGGNFNGINATSFVANNLKYVEGLVFSNTSVSGLSFPALRYVKNGVFFDSYDTSNGALDLNTIFPELRIMLENTAISTSATDVIMPANLRMFNCNLNNVMNTLIFKGHPVFVRDWWGMFANVSLIKVPNDYLTEWKNADFWRDRGDIFVGYDPE